MFGKCQRVDLVTGHGVIPCVEKHDDKASIGMIHATRSTVVRRRRLESRSFRPIIAFPNTTTHMAIQRSEIDNALKELITYEGGMKFQALAVVLAKLIWNDLVASEWKNDLGLDAYVNAAAALDHVGKGLACSITPTLSKITADSEKAHKHFNDISLLIFATPNKVSNRKKLEWSEVIRRKFGYELVVISREEIITQLTMPGNAALCRSFLGMDVAVPERREESLSHIRQASGVAVKGWEARLQGRPLIQLRARRLDARGDELPERFGLADIHASLKESRRVVLVAPGRPRQDDHAHSARAIPGTAEGRDCHS